MPRVSIGMPVYNGERFLRETLDSILCQTYRDYELVISDNCSTDHTLEICKEYAARDPRIRLYVESTNRGAAWNYNRVVDLATGQYFKWAAHDDLLEPEYLAACVEVLDGQAGVVLSYPDDQDIDQDRNPIDRKRHSHIPMAERASAATPSRRLRDLMRLDYDCEQVFGLIRTDVLRKTRLIGPYTDSDRTLLVELGLYGTFVEVPRPLFLHRHHVDSSCRANPIDRSWGDRAAWFDPRLQGKVLFSQWRQLREYVSAVHRAPLSPAEQARCFFWLGVRYRHRVKPLLEELVIGVRMFRAKPPAAQ
jgi:glycosyltransferase involved in cell wall biosynthesis